MATRSDSRPTTLTWFSARLAVVAPVMVRPASVSAGSTPAAYRSKALACAYTLEYVSEAADLSMAAWTGGEMSRCEEEEEQEEVGAEELSARLWQSKSELCAESWDESGK